MLLSCSAHGECSSSYTRNFFSKATHERQISLVPSAVLVFLVGSSIKQVCGCPAVGAPSPWSDPTPKARFRYPLFEPAYGLSELGPTPKPTIHSSFSPLGWNSTGAQGSIGLDVTAQATAWIQCFGTWQLCRSHTHRACEIDGLATHARLLYGPLALFLS